ncbi:hypothetical protein GEMRC1_007828 [Eukaryota sp. GEM-RC1]
MPSFSPDLLVSWYTKFHAENVRTMRRSMHSVAADCSNKYHLEDDVWSHTCMTTMLAAVFALLLMLSLLPYFMMLVKQSHVKPPIKDQNNSLNSYCLARLSPFTLDAFSIARYVGLHMQISPLLRSVQTKTFETAILARVGRMLMAEPLGFVDELLQVSINDVSGRFASNEDVSRDLSFFGPGKALSRVSGFYGPQWIPKPFSVPPTFKDRSPSSHLVLVFGYSLQRPEILTELVSKGFTMFEDCPIEFMVNQLVSCKKVAVVLLRNVLSWNKYLSAARPKKAFLEGIGIFPFVDLSSCLSFHLHRRDEDFFVKYPQVPIITLNNFDRVTFTTCPDHFSTCSRGALSRNIFSDC